MTSGVVCEKAVFNAQKEEYLLFGEESDGGGTDRHSKKDQGVQVKICLAVEEEEINFEGKLLEEERQREEQIRLKMAKTQKVEDKRGEENGKKNSKAPILKKKKKQMILSLTKKLKSQS